MLKNTPSTFMNAYPTRSQMHIREKQIPLDFVNPILCEVFRNLYLPDARNLIRRLIFSPS